MANVHSELQIFLSSIVICMFFAASLASNASAESVSEENLPRLVEKLLKERPELILDILRNHSEAVLDIAQQGSNLRRRHNLEAQWKDDCKKEKKAALAGRPSTGGSDAKVQIIAFTDFTCHYCQQASHTIDAIMHNYGKKVRLVFKSLPLDEKGPGAVAAAYFLAAAQQNEKLAWKLYAMLFANRDKLVAEGEPFLKKSAERIGLNMKQLQRDVQSKKITDMIAEDLQDAQNLGIEGTPYFLVNRLVVRGALPLDLFKVAVDMALQQAK